MGRHFSAPTLAALRIIQDQGSADYLEIEIKTGQSGGVHRISHMLKSGYIQALPKERGRLKRYKITPAGMKVLKQEVAEPTQRLIAFKMPVWVPKEFAPIRSGAMDAYRLPSRGF